MRAKNFKQECFPMICVVLSGVLFLVSLLLNGFNVYGQATQVIETEVTPDEMILSPTRVDSSLKGDVTLGEAQLMQINQNLKNVIEENQKLLEQNKTVTKEVEQLRGQNQIQTGRINSLTSQRDTLEKQRNETLELNKKQTQELEGTKKTLSEKEAELKSQIKDLEDQITKETSWRQEAQDALDSRTAPGKKLNPKKVISNLDKLDVENDKLRMDAAKVHYNLGNIYFKQAMYDKALAEYKRSVELMPFDANAHYNLAFVSAEYLGDQETALKHYQQYLYLNPHAEDRDFINEKILNARLILKARIKSPIDDKETQNSGATQFTPKTK